MQSTTELNTSTASRPEQAIKRLKAKNEFKVHLVVYLTVNASSGLGLDFVGVLLAHLAHRWVGHWCGHAWLHRVLGQRIHRRADRTGDEVAAVTRHARLMHGPICLMNSSPSVVVSVLGCH
jgi:hypothetical protein